MPLQNVVQFPSRARERKVSDYVVMLSGEGATVEYEILGATDGGEMERARIAEMLRAIADKLDPV